MSARARRFVFQGVGTRGSILPLVWLAGELVRRGHECHLLANAAYGEDAARRGIAFFPTTRQTEIFWGPEREDPDNYQFACLPPVADYFRRHHDPSVPTVVVNADRLFASNLLCERLELPAVRLYLTPFKVRSLAAPPWPLGRSASGRLGHSFRTYALPRILESGERDPRVLATINRRRASVGLPPVDAAYGPEPHLRRHVALFPPWYAPPAEDWPHGIRFAGFPFMPPTGERPRALDEFVAAQGRPIVFTPGTCVPQDADRFFDLATACCAALGMPGVFLCPYLDPRRRGAASNVLCLDYVDLALLLGDAAALVHHGGIGTTAQAIRAGIPQVILPRTFDQPDNGRRVSKLGIGAAFEREGLTGESLARAVRGLLDDPAVGSALAECRAKLDGTDAIASTCDVLEGVEVAPAARPPCARASARRVMLVAWPDADELASPMTLARALHERGDRVVVAGARALRSQVRWLGFEHADLEGASDWGQRWSLFAPMPHRAALREAVDRFVVSFDAAVERYRPDAVLLDARYSAFAVVAAARGLRWALYEADVPRELDACTPPPLVGSAARTDLLRTAWANQMGYALAARELAVAADLPLDWTLPYFTSSLIEELRRRFGALVRFDRFALWGPIARGPRMVFCPREFDFERGRTEGRATWVGACIDDRRIEAPVPWEEIPRGVPLVYAALGLDGRAAPRAKAWVQAVVDALAPRSDVFVVLACPEALRPRLPRAGANVLLLDGKPRPSVLRRARLTISDASFHRLKDCAAYGVPVVAVVLSDEQARHAALVEHHGLGVVLAGGDPAPARRIAESVDRVLGCPRVSARCSNVRRSFDEGAGPARALAFVDQLVGCD